MFLENVTFIKFVTYIILCIMRVKLSIFCFEKKYIKKTKKVLTSSKIFDILLMRLRKKAQMRKSSLKTEQNVNLSS